MIICGIADCCLCFPFETSMLYFMSIIASTFISNLIFLHCKIVAMYRSCVLPVRTNHLRSDLIEERIVYILSSLRRLDSRCMYTLMWIQSTGYLVYHTYGRVCLDMINWIGGYIVVCLTSVFIDFIHTCVSSQLDT